MRYSPTLALEVCRGIERGEGTGASYGRLYGLDEKEIGIWLMLYRCYGASVFYKKPAYSREERADIAADKVKNGLTLAQTCVKYKILHRSSLRNWIRLYKGGRTEPMSEKNRKNKKKEATPADPAAAATHIRELERELLYVKAENAYLKKLQALMQATKNQSAD